MVVNGSSSECTANVSCDLESHDVFSAETDIFSVILAALIVASNTLVVALFTKERSLRQPNNIILVSLAVSDLLAGLLSLPMFMVCDIKRSGAVCFASIFPVIFTSISTVSHLTAVTVDRWISIRKALQYPSIVTKKRALLAVAVIWLGTVMVTLMHFLWLDPLSFDPHEQPSERVRRSEIIFDSVSFVLFIVLPLPFMAATYVWIFRQVHRHNQNIQQHQCNVSNQVYGDYSPERRAALIFLGMFVTYAVCWTPYFLLRLSLNSGNDPPAWALYLIMFLRFGSSFINPWMYILGKKDFRKAVRVCCCKKSTAAKPRKRSKRSREAPVSRV